MIKIAIIGAGFAGTALAATLVRYSQHPLEITLIEKDGCFGAGAAYRTPYSFHLLNVRAKDMSAFADEPMHFVEWLQKNKPDLATDEALADRFVPRQFYAQYLAAILAATSNHVQLQLLHAEVVDVKNMAEGGCLYLQDGQQLFADKVVFALGNPAVSAFPFPVGAGMHTINNPWDYTAPQHIPTDESVLIVGTGLSMIDTILTLYNQNHRGKIYAVSRHGLLPLPHSAPAPIVRLQPFSLSTQLSKVYRQIREQAGAYLEAGHDWRQLMQVLREHVPSVWQQLSLADKKRFLRHVLPYWNIHRHRVHPQLDALLKKLMTLKQLQIIAGNVLAASDANVRIRERSTQQEIILPLNWLINCLGPSLNLKNQQCLASLITSGDAQLDALQLGIVCNEAGALISKTKHISTTYYILGAYRKGGSWETNAVPEIRQQVHTLAHELLK